MNEETIGKSLYAVVALNCQEVSDLANLFDGNGKMHEETKHAFLAYVNQHFETA